MSGSFHPFANLSSQLAAPKFQTGGPFLSPLMAVSSQNGSDLQLDQLLQAMAGQLGINSPAALPSSSDDAREEAPHSSLGMVRLVEVVLEPAKRACLGELRHSRGSQTLSSGLAILRGAIQRFTCFL